MVIPLWLNAMAAGIIAFTLHEVAHVLAAEMQGDRTAVLAGRKTLDPIAHLDMIPALLTLTLTMALFQLPVMGGKPVPVAPWVYARRKGWMVAGAGVAMNLYLALVCWLADWQIGWVMNIAFAAVNLVPIPTLDGYWLWKTLRHGKRCYHWPMQQTCLVCGKGK